MVNIFKASQFLELNDNYDVTNCCFHLLTGIIILSSYFHFLFFTGEGETGLTDNDYDNASLYAPPPTYEDVINTNLYPPTPQQQRVQYSGKPKKI